LRRGPTSLLIVGGLHLVVFWALINAFHANRASAPRTDSNIVADVIDSPRPPPEKFVPPDVPQTQVAYRTVDPVVHLPPLDDGPTITQQPLPFIEGPSDPVTREPQPVITGAAVDPRHPLTQPDYPMSARRLDEQGKVALEVLIGTDGRVVDVRVAQSSGSLRLDQAAMNEARAHWRLRPATRNGVPFEQWLTLGVIFRLENR